MSRLSPLRLRVIALVSGLVLIASLVVIAVHSGGKGGPSIAARGSPAPGGLAPGAAPVTATLPPLPPTGAGSASAGSVSGQSTPAPTAPTATVAPSALAGPSHPGPVKPTTPGTYHYAEQIHNSSGDSSSTVVFKVSDQSNTPGELRQTLSQTGTDPSSGKQVTTTQEVSWRADGLYLRSQQFVFGGSTYTCVFTPPVQELALPLGTGRQWTLQGSCPVTFLGQTVNVRLSGSAKVTGTDRVAVGGVAVDVWVVESTVDVTGSGAFAFTLHQTATHWIAPAQGIEASEASTTTSTFGQGQPSTTTERRQLQRLQPS